MILPDRVLGRSAVNTMDFGFPMGPYAMSDLAGLDIGWKKETSSSSTLREMLCERDRRGPCDRGPVQQRHVLGGHRRTAFLPQSARHRSRRAGGRYRVRREPDPRPASRSAPAPPTARRPME